MTCCEYAIPAAGPAGPRVDGARSGIFTATIAVGDLRRDQRPLRGRSRSWNPAPEGVYDYMKA